MGNEIICLCRQNVNRSPIAARILQTQVERYGLEGDIYSRGYEVRERSYIDESLNRKLIRRNYGTLADHRACQISPDEIARAGIILAMSPRQMMHVRALFSDYSSKIHSLPEYALGPHHAKKEVRDPNRSIIDAVEPYRNANYRWQAHVAHHLPVLLSRFFLRTFARGRVDNRDREYISAFLEGIIDDIENYTVKAIPKLVKEGHLHPKR